MNGDKLVFRGLIASPDGAQFYDTTREGKPEDAVAMGHDAGMELKVIFFFWRFFGSFRQVSCVCDLVCMSVSRSVSNSRRSTEFPRRPATGSSLGGNVSTPERA